MTSIQWVVIALVAFCAALWAANRFLKPFFWRIAICLTPLMLGAIVVGMAWQRYQMGEGGFRLGVDLVGGTILVYEVDVSKFPDGKMPENYRPEELAASLKRRIDPADLYNVTIRPMSNTRVEIILPTGGKHQAEADEARWDDLIKEIGQKWPPAKPADYEVGRGKVPELVDEVAKDHPDASREDVVAYIDSHYRASRNLSSEEIQNVKEKIAQVGLLEFRILANDRDDKEGIDAARKYLADLSKTPQGRAELDKYAKAGQPPPAPHETFKTKLGDFNYSWVELGRSERADLGLDNAAENDPARNGFWKQVAQARQKGETVDVQGNSSVLYSRKCLSVGLSERDRDKKYEYFLLTRDPERDPADPSRRKDITGDYLTSANEDHDQRGQLAVGFHFNQRGGNLFYELTSRNAPTKSGETFHRNLAIVLDHQIVSAPRLNDPISTDGIISGHFTKEQVDRLVGILRAGALPATLKPQPVSENTMGATLGEDTIRKGTFAVGVAFVAILIFMVVYYRFAGFVACVALTANLLLTVAFMVAVHATFTLPGLAGLVLMLGMAVDANVLIYERLREERDRGAGLSLAIRNGYDRAFPTIIDTHLSSIFTAIVLYAVGNDQLKGFGVSLTVGLIISLFTSLFMTRLLFDIWLSRGWLHKLSMFRLLSRPNINFMGIRYYWFTATILLTIFGISVFIWRLPQDLNIDFVGGTAYGGQLVEPESLSELRGQLSEERQKELLAVKDVRPLDTEGMAYQITYADGVTRRIALPNAATAQDVKERAEVLPDVSVEAIFPATQAEVGNKSRYFTIRTSEKAAELVQASIGRLLGDKLKRMEMSFTPDKDDKGAVLHFTDPSNEGAAVYASPSQVQMLLEREFRGAGVVQALSVKGEQGTQGKEESDRFSAMRLTLAEPVPAAKLDKALADTKHEFDQRPTYDRLENFDSQLASETQLRAMYAILASWAAILLYLWFRFGSWTFGMAAVLCLIHDLFFSMGIIAFCHYIHLWMPGLASALKLEDFKIDLPAVAALLTLVGYSTNDTIVVFDRIREVRGKNPELTPQMINDSVNQTLSRTLLTAFSVWLVVFVLYWFGGEGVHLFAFCMVVGVIVGTYSSIYIASPLLLIFGEGAKPAKVPQRQPVPVGAPVGAGR